MIPCRFQVDTQHKLVNGPADQAVIAFEYTIMNLIRHPPVVAKISVRSSSTRMPNCVRKATPAQLMGRLRKKNSG